MDSVIDLKIHIIKFLSRFEQTSYSQRTIEQIEFNGRDITLGLASALASGNILESKTIRGTSLFEISDKGRQYAKAMEETDAMDTRDTDRRG